LPGYPLEEQSTAIPPISRAADWRAQAEVLDLLEDGQQLLRLY
jgi:hypothetical protein